MTSQRTSETYFIRHARKLLVTFETSWKACGYNNTAYASCWLPLKPPRKRTASRTRSLRTPSFSQTSTRPVTWTRQHVLTDTRCSYTHHIHDSYEEYPTDLNISRCIRDSYEEHPTDRIIKQNTLHPFFVDTTTLRPFTRTHHTSFSRGHTTRPSLADTHSVPLRGHIHTTLTDTTALRLFVWRYTPSFALLPVFPLITVPEYTRVFAEK